MLARGLYSDKTIHLVISLRKTLLVQKSFKEFEMSPHFIRTDHTVTRYSLVFQHVVFWWFKFIV